MYGVVYGVYGAVWGLQRKCTMQYEVYGAVRGRGVYSVNVRGVPWCTLFLKVYENIAAMIL